MPLLNAKLIIIETFRLIMSRGALFAKYCAFVEAFRIFYMRSSVSAIKAIPGAIRLAGIDE